MSTAQPAIVLALNSGSSSLKFGLYQVSAEAVQLLISGSATELGEPGSKFEAHDQAGKPLISRGEDAEDLEAVMQRISACLDAAKAPAATVVTHRVVHGGPKVRRHCIIDSGVMQALESAVVFAPLHAPPALTVIRFAQAHYPHLPHIACLDTAFHAGLPDVARTLPIAKELQAEGIWKYGFHGLSCESILHQLGDSAPKRMIIAHLGGGASITAINQGKSIDTTMGLTPTGGLIMSTRSGDLDPGVLVYLAREKGFDADQLEDLLDHHSGLKGISDLSPDLRVLQKAAAENPNADLAIEMFCYAARKQLAGMIAVLDGLDLLVFTGGIGENDAKVRASICEGLGWIGLVLDAPHNRASNNPISDPSSRCEVVVLPSREDEQMARHGFELTR